MRTVASLALLASLAAAHGGRFSGTGQGISGPQVFRHGGVPSTPNPAGKTNAGWETWWAYNREVIIAQRLRAPISGRRNPETSGDRLSRQKLREQVLYDLMLRALGDKNHLVRSSAAVALGKFGKPEANRRLHRLTSFPGEGWFDVREGALYAMSILGLTENRLMLKVIAGDKRRPIKERGFAVFGLSRDGSRDSADLVVWHLNYHRSGLNLQSWQDPTTAEEEKRRVAAHMLGFVGKDVMDPEPLLYRVAVGARKWGDGCQGLAVTALGRRRARDYIERLFRMMDKRDTPRAVKQSIPIALGMMLRRSDQADVRRLARFIRDFRRDNIVQHFTAMALADIGGDQAIDILLGLIRDNVINDDRDRAWLYLALARIAHSSDKAKQVLLSKYERASTEEIRAVLALACGMARVKQAVPITIERLGLASPPSSGSKSGPLAGGPPPRDSNSKAPANFLTYGLLGLGFHGDPRGLDVVRGKFKRQANPVVRHNAALALALIRRQDAIPELIEALEESGNQLTKAGIIVALGLMPEPTKKLVDALTDVYRTDSQPNGVRALAVIALGTLGDDGVVPLSALLTSRYNYHIRSQTLDELSVLH